jgi:Lon protease-like protein
VLEEERTDLPYRQGRLELLHDRYPSPSVIHRERRRRELLATFRDLFPHADLEPLLREALVSPCSLGVLCDVLAYAMRQDPQKTQQVLSELDVDQRSDLLLEQLRDQLRSQRRNGVESGFPPAFSRN